MYRLFKNKSGVFMKKQSVKLNFIYNTIYQLLLILLPIITAPFISRTLGSQGIGIYSYTYSIASTFALFGMLGIMNYGNKVIATVQENRVERSKVFWNIWSIQIIFSLISIIFYLVYIFFFSKEQFRYVLIVQVVVVLCSLVDINWFFFGMEKIKLTVFRNIIIKIVTVVFLFLFVKNEKDLIVYTLIMTGGLFLGNISVFSFLKREIDFVPPSLKKIKKHIKPIFVLFVPVIAVTLYKRIDKVMLGSFSTMEQVGFFENADKIINLPLGFITALGTVMLPRMSYLFAKDRQEESILYISYSMEFVCFLSSALMFGISGVAKEFAPMFFGEEFAQVGLLLIVMAPTILFIAWANVIRTQYLIPLEYNSIYLASVWIGALLNLLLNIFLIPKLGAMGTVIGTVCAEFSVMFYQSMRVRKKLPISRFVKQGSYYFCAGFVMFICLRLFTQIFENDINSMILKICLGVGIYLLLTLPYIFLNHKKETMNIMNRSKEK